MSAPGDLVDRMLYASPWRTPGAPVSLDPVETRMSDAQELLEKMANQVIIPALPTLVELAPIARLDGIQMPGPHAVVPKEPVETHSSDAKKF